MLRELRFQYSCPDKQCAEVLMAICEGFVRANHMMIDAKPRAYPCCINCGKLSYVPPKACVICNGDSCQRIPACQTVKGAPWLMKVGEGTCIDLACMLAAIKRHKGDIAAYVDIKPAKAGWHATVIDGDGKLHDPQKMLTTHGETCECKHHVGAGEYEDDEDEDEDEEDEDEELQEPEVKAGTG